MTLFRSNPPAARNGSTTDGPISLGVEFKVTSDGCTLNGFRFYQGAAPWSGTVTAALYEVGGTTQLTAPVTISTLSSLPSPPVATASSDPIGYSPSAAIDGDPSTRWLGTAPTASVPQWLKVTYTTGQVVTGYRITPHPSSNSYSPTAWIFQGSNDGTTWTDLDTRSGVTWGAVGVAQSYACANAAAFTQYRILISAVNGATDYVSIAELVLDGAIDGAWREATLATPFPLTTGKNYRAAILFGGSSRPSNNGGMGATLTSGPLTVPATSASTNGNHTYAYGATLQNPTGSGGSNYLLDVIVEQGAAPATTFTGQVDAVTGTQGALTVTTALTGQVDAVSGAQGSPTVTVQMSGQADATSATEGLLASGTTLAFDGQVDAVTDTEGLLGISVPVAGQVDAITDAAGDVTVSLGFTGQADATSGTAGDMFVNLPENQLSAHSTTRITSHVGAPITADPISATSRTRIVSHMGLPKDVDFLSASSSTRITSSATVGLDIALDPVTGRPQYRLIVVDSHGTPLGELQNATVGDPVQRLGQAGTLNVSLPNNDPKASLLDVGAQVQVWAGAEMLPGAWFVLVQPGKDGSGSISYDFVGLEGLLDNVVIGTDRPELLKNGGFEEGLKYWHPAWLPGSAAEAPPKTTIVSGSLAKDGGKALQVEAVESVNVREVKTAAIFYGNRPYASEPLSAGFLPGGEKVITDQLPAFSKGTKLLVEGFTADVDSGDGQALSQRRAEAAKAVILKARPDLKVTAVGRGETVQVAPNNTPENQAKNRRIVLTGTATRVGHRQIVRQYFKWTNDGRVPIELELDGWINLIAYVGPSKDRYGFYINRIKTLASKEAPFKTPSGADLKTLFEDGSATYTDGLRWDPDTGRFTGTPDRSPSGAAVTQGPFEDDSAVYADSLHWDPDLGKFTGIPTQSPSGAKLKQSFEDGSATYADGLVWDPDFGGFKKDRVPVIVNPKTKIVQAEHTDLPEDFPHSRWTPDGTSEMYAPPDGREYLYEVRLYGSAGKTVFDEVSVKPNLRNGYYKVTRPELFSGLVAEAQNPAHGKVDLNLETNCPAWGVLDDYEYEWKSPRTVWDAIEEQLRADDAPDFGIVTTQTRRIATTWPKRGRVSQVQFRLGDVVVGYSAGVDGDKVATTGIVTSNRSRGPGVVEARVRTAPINGLVLERVQAAEPDRSKTRLRQMATAMTRYGRTDVLTSVTCDPKWTVYLLSHVGLGDRVWCSVHDGDTNAEGWYRIVEIRHSLANHQLSYELTPEV